MDFRPPSLSRRTRTGCRSAPGWYPGTFDATRPPDLDPLRGAPMVNGRRSQRDVIGIDDTLPLSLSLLPSTSFGNLEHLPTDMGKYQGGQELLHATYILHQGASKIPSLT
eukprot:scaffold124638_cov33-Tisochrysis_lutea.AAC.2